MLAKFLNGFGYLNKGFALTDIEKVIGPQTELIKKYGGHFVVVMLAGMYDLQFEIIVGCRHFFEARYLYKVGASAHDDANFSVSFHEILFSTNPSDLK